MSAPDSSPFLCSDRRRGNALVHTNRAGGSPLSLSPPSRLPRLRLPRPPRRLRACVCAQRKAAELQQRPRREEEEVEVEAGREANSCLTSSQSEAWLRLTKTAGPGRAPPPHSSFEALVEMCRLLCLHSAACCRCSRLFVLF